MLQKLPFTITLINRLMKNCFSACLFTWLTCFISAPFYAQANTTGDVLLWSSIGFDYKLNKKIKLKLEQNLRLKNDMSTRDEYFTEFSVDYELFKDFEITAGFRYITENDDQGRIQGDENHFRYQFDISYKYDYKRFTFSHRIRYQNKNELGISVEQGDLPRETLRFKTGIDYNIRKWKLDPKFDAELFSRKQDNNLLFSDMQATKYRITLGTSYNLKKLGELDLYYRIENDVKAHPDFRVQIIGIGYKYSLN